MASWPAGLTALSGAILPHSRVVAYYGNPNSKKMGVLGEYPEQQMLSMLDDTVTMWRQADPSTPVMPAIHLVAVVAQGSAGPDGGWRRRESPQTIEQAYRWAQSRQGLLFVDARGFSPLTFVAAALLLAVAAVAASYIPARRAARVSPVDTLTR